MQFETTTSDDVPLKCGVPQGSVISLVIFTLYTDRYSQIQTDRNIHLGHNNGWKDQTTMIIAIITILLSITITSVHTIHVVLFLN